MNAPRICILITFVSWKQPTTEIPRAETNPKNIPSLLILKENTGTITDTTIQIMNAWGNDDVLLIQLIEWKLLIYLYTHTQIMITWQNALANCNLYLYLVPQISSDERKTSSTCLYRMYTTNATVNIWNIITNYLWNTFANTKTKKVPWTFKSFTHFPNTVYILLKL
jgi:hypothetical protein